MSRPDHTPRVGVDFAPRPERRRRPVLVIATVIVALAALLMAVTQLLLR